MRSRVGHARLVVLVDDGTATMSTAQLRDQAKSAEDAGILERSPSESLSLTGPTDLVGTSNLVLWIQPAGLLAHDDPIGNVPHVEFSWREVAHSSRDPQLHPTAKVRQNAPTRCHLVGLSISHPRARHRPRRYETFTGPASVALFDSRKSSDFGRFWCGRTGKSRLLIGVERPRMPPMNQSLGI